MGKPLTPEERDTVITLLREAMSTCTLKEVEFTLAGITRDEIKWWRAHARYLAGIIRKLTQ